MIETSAVPGGPAGPTVVDAVPVLFAVVASPDVVVAEAEFVTMDDAGAPALIWTTMENVAEALTLSAVIAQLTVPVPPTAGFVHVNVGPAV